MKKSTLAAQSGASIAVIALLTSLAQADSARYNEINSVEFDMENAATAAIEASTGEVIEIELEMDDATPVWEVDIVNEANQLVTVEIDGQTGKVLSTSWDDDAVEPLINAVSLSQAINIVKAVEQGAIVEAELENEDGNLIWEIESIGTSNHQTKFRVDAETGEIII